MVSSLLPMLSLFWYAVGDKSDAAERGLTSPAWRSELRAEARGREHTTLQPILCFSCSFRPKNWYRLSRHRRGILHVLLLLLSCRLGICPSFLYNIYRIPKPPPLLRAEEAPSLTLKSAIREILLLLRVTYGNVKTACVQIPQLSFLFTVLVCLSGAKMQKMQKQFEAGTKRTQFGIVGPWGSYSAPSPDAFLRGDACARAEPQPRDGIRGGA
ncbi:hypothetical protein B0T18DRAFT_183068 [Schizothecium vesticola]|uniref:Uncharacterized protein n=1 Tax=Schizothecium vesticola TaxID=314040 RepID=A0AA40K2L3_9PEZI|nr:hypothetical protein B0T18DRAFT_183068 [Schizothecium vesticola]